MCWYVPAALYYLVLVPAALCLPMSAPAVTLPPGSGSWLPLVPMGRQGGLTSTLMEALRQAGRRCL